MLSYVLNKLVYMTMFGLGSYFIYKGDVVQRFQLKRTNFAVYEEAIYKLPNTVMYIWPPNKNITFGKDYWIHYDISQKKQDSDWKMLKKGNNTIEGQRFVLIFQNLYEGLSWQKKRPNS